MLSSHLDRTLPHDLAQFCNVVVLLNGCSQVPVVLRLCLRLPAESSLLVRQKKKQNKRKTQLAVDNVGVKGSSSSLPDAD